MLGKDGLDSWVGQEWQELPLGSGLGRTVPKSTGDPGRALTGEWLVVTAETSDAHLGGGVQRGHWGPSRMGTVPSLSSWATVVPEQAPRWAEAGTCCLGHH